MKPRPDTRTRLVEAAMELFALQGYAATGLAQVARQAECHPGSLYYFFPSKEDLLHATLERRKELVYDGVLRPVWERIDDPIERVFGLLAGYRAMLEMSAFQHGCPIGNLVLEVGNSHPRTRQLLCENFDGWRAAVEECFSAARDRLPAHVDCRRLALFVLTTMEGAVMLARSYRHLEAYDSAVVSLREYIDALVETGSAWRVPIGSPYPDVTGFWDPAPAPGGTT